MKKEKNRYGWERMLIFGLGCVFAGAINGLLGTGGGVLLVLLLTKLFKTDAKDSFAQSLLMILPLSAVSAFVYCQKGGVSLAQMLPYLFPAVIGGILGAYLADKINARVLKIIFAILVVYSGVRMIFVK